MPKRRPTAAPPSLRPQETRGLRPAVMAVVSDIHVGSTVALCPPDGIALEDGGRYMPSPLQQWIWDGWVGYWDHVYQKVDELDADLIVEINGEPVDGNHHSTTQIASPAPDAMEVAAVEALKAVKVTERARKIYVVKGSAAHSKSGGQSDNAVARAIGAERDPETGQYAFYQLFLDVYGVCFDFAHHVSNSGRPWTKGTNIRSEVLMAIDDGAAAGRVPDVVVRSHVHVYADTGLNFRTKGFITPAWQLRTEFVHKVSRGMQRTVGGLLFSVTPSGGLTCHPPFLKSLPLPPAVKALP